MFTSTLLNKLNEDKNFNWKAAAAACDDFNLFIESSCLLDVSDKKITTQVRNGKQLVVSYPDGTQTLFAYRENSKDFIVFPGNDTSYIAIVETCGDISAFVSHGEVVLVLPKQNMEGLLNA